MLFATTWSFNLPVVSAVNPKDFENIVEKKKVKEMNFNAQFEGITLQLAHKTLQVIYTKVSGKPQEYMCGI